VCSTFEFNRDPPFRSYGLSLIVQGIDTQLRPDFNLENRAHLTPEARTHSNANPTCDRVLGDSLLHLLFGLPL